MSDAPVQVSAKYTKADILNEAAEEQWVDGAIVALTVSKAGRKTFSRKKDLPGTEGLALNFQLSVLDPDTESPMANRLFHYVGLPLRHPEFPDAEPASWTSGSRSTWAEFCGAFMAEDFEKLSHEEAAEKRLELAVKHYNEEAVELIGQVMCYATIKHEVGDDGRIFVKASRLRPELYPGEALTPKENLKARIIPGGGNGATGPAAPAENSDKTKTKTKPSGKGKGKKK